MDWADGWRGELGGEPDLAAYVAHLVEVFAAMKRVLRDDGCLFLVIGDSYAGGGNHSGRNDAHTLRAIDANSGRRPNAMAYGERERGAPRARTPRHGFADKPKTLLEVPSEVVRALKADGWWLRSRMPWLKRNCMPESVRDRPTSAVEYVFLLTKQSSYYWDPIAIARPAAEARVYPTWEQRKANGAAIRRGDPGHSGDVHRGGVTGPGLGGDGATRQFRNSDLYFDSRAPGFWDDDAGPAGLLLDEAGDPLALEVNPTPYAGAHFATFPPKLVEPLIRAATSERGVCPACLSPYRRIVERTKGEVAERPKARALAATGSATNGTNGSTLSIGGHAGAGWQGRGSRAATAGWAPTCQCDDGPPIPATVLDCFSGAGTTGLVCAQLGRDYVGIELSPVYAEQSAARIRDEAPLLNTVVVEVDR